MALALEIGYRPQAEWHDHLRWYPIVCVDVAIIRDGQVLLVKRGNKPAQGQWWLPGGRVWKGEMLEETAVRKAKEEVGLFCDIGEVIHTAEMIFPDGPEGSPVHSVNTVFTLYPLSNDEVILDSNHLDHKWLGYEWNRLNDNLLHPYITQSLHKLFNGN